MFERLNGQYSLYGWERFCFSCVLDESGIFLVLTDCSLLLWSIFFLIYLDIVDSSYLKTGKKKLYIFVRLQVILRLHFK
ncbi:hypothetical protein L2E82_49076 [Cichorium intybus]|uniref:Uncharacterized protein n=1 Tax=Cichorium intybus TaxID=13427 RepID=A0ACB8Z0X3_CICIN|nr:hypothetical protein L2E82_49076 [Cichorium intybus]